MATTLMQRCCAWSLVVAGLVWPMASAAQPAANPVETRRLHELFDADWQWRMRNYPEWATELGDHRFGDRLNDRSRQAEDAAEAYRRSLLTQLRAIARGKLSGKDRVSYDMLLRETQEEIEGHTHRGLRTMIVSADGGLHMEFTELLTACPAETEADARKVLARMAQFPSRIDQVVERLREGIASGWVASRPSIERVPAQIDAQLTDDPAKSPLYEPFNRLGAALPEATRARLALEGKLALREQVFPAMHRLRRFIVDEYLPRAPANGAMSSHPGGAAAYAYLVRKQTTTPLEVAAIHAIGLGEVARLRTLMEAQMKLSGFTGGFAEFVNFLNSDPRFFHTSADAMLAHYRDIAKRVEPELPKLFAELPKATYGIRPIPAHEGAGRSDNYTIPAADGSRPGWFNANVLALKRRPIWSMESLFVHETVPGHHLQTARALEMKGLPMFRRSAFHVAYGEGWAVYAETLGEQLGLYQDPYNRFGHLQALILRAARLVVDTGIHAMGWSRAQAIDWMSERAGLPREYVEAQVDRYYAWPAQALGYTIGQLKFVELRERARAALGDRFDIRRFHMAVLDNGSLPLSVLELQVDDWIAVEKTKQRAR